MLATIGARHHLPGVSISAATATPPVAAPPRAPQAQPATAGLGHPALGGAGTPRRWGWALDRSPSGGPLALLAILATALGVVAFSSAAPSVLVPRSTVLFPAWFSGPLHGLFGRGALSPDTLSIGFTAAAGALALLYVVVLRRARTLSARTVVVGVVALHLIMLLGPPLQLTDLFNYLGYARLGALHGLNPYTHVIAEATYDPVFRFTTWHHLKSPYGPAFTALTYPLALLPLSVAYWLLKSAIIAASLACLALIWHLAARLGRDPRLAVLFVAANPITILYLLGGFHNDVFMLAPALGAMALLLAGRERAAGAVLMLAVAVKFNAIVLLPFLMVGAGSAARRRRVAVGAAMGMVTLVGLSVLLFGPHLPNLSDQSSLLTYFSVPNMVGLLLGLGGGAPVLLHLADLALVITIAVLLLRCRDWLSGAGWAMVALLASLAWLVPWYIIWLLPLAALAPSRRLRRVGLSVTLFLLLTFVPATGMILSRLHFNPAATGAGRASALRQGLLAQ